MACYEACADAESSLLLSTMRPHEARTAGERPVPTCSTDAASGDACGRRACDEDNAQVRLSESSSIIRCAPAATPLAYW